MERKCVFCEYFPLVCLSSPSLLRSLPPPPSRKAAHKQSRHPTLTLCIVRHVPLYLSYSEEEDLRGRHRILSTFSRSANLSSELSTTPRRTSHMKLQNEQTPRDYDASHKKLTALHASTNYPLLLSNKTPILAPTPPHSS